MPAHPLRVRDRRRWPRISTFGLVVAHFADDRRRVDVPDFSIGGCSLVLRTPIAIGDKREVVFSVRRAVEVPLRVEVVDCRQAGDDWFQVSCRFIAAGQPEVQERVAALMDQALDTSFSAEGLH